MSTVFVTGANGFIAQHIVKQLLAKGYTVIGSVRSHSKGQELKSLIQSENFCFEVIPTLETPGAFNDVLQRHPEISVFLHTASPVDLTTTDIEEVLLKPAIDGTKHVLDSIKSYGVGVEKVVITSSAVATIGWDIRHWDKKKVYTENDWNPIKYKEGFEDGNLGYHVSKKYAELAVHEFVKKEKPQFDVSFVNPVYVFGPQAYEIKDKSKLNVSAEVVNGIAKSGKGDSIGKYASIFVDVRDVARAHLIAFEKEEAVGKKLLMESENFSLNSITEIINRRFPKSNVPKGDISQDEQFFKNSVQKFDNSETKNLLDFDFISLEQSVYDTVKQIYA